MVKSQETCVTEAVSDGKACLPLILLLAFALRLVHLGTFAFWHDETHNLLISQDLRGAILEGQLIANHPPLPYFLLALWRLIGMGYNEWTIRGLPLLFGVMGVAAVYWLGKVFFDRRTGLVAAFLLAISPFHVLHSQDLKEYIYLPFFATVMIVFFYRGTLDNRKGDWFFYGLFAGISCYTEAFVAPLLIAINLWFLVLLPGHKSRFWNWMLSNMFGALLFLPWAGVMLGRVHTYLIAAEHWWVPWPNVWSIIFYFKTIAFGYTAQKPFFYLAFMLFAVAGVLGSIVALQRNRKSASLLLSWAVIPVAIVFALSYIGQSIFLTRAMLPYSIAVYVLVAVGIASVSSFKARTGILVPFALLCAVGLHGYYVRDYPPEQHPHRPGTHPPREYDKAATYILERLEEGDLVIHAAQSTWLPFYWYGFSNCPQYVAGHSEDFCKLIISSNPVNTTYEKYLRLWPKVIENLVNKNPRIWYVFSEWERSYLKGNAMSLYRWLDSRYVEVEHTNFEGIEILLYLTPQHHTMPEILGRDTDTGASATLSYSTIAESYRKILPDASTIKAPLAEREGNLILSFADEYEAIGRSRQMAFMLKNNGATASDCNIVYLESSLLLPCSAFTRTITTESAWNYEPFWNCGLPPDTYDLATIGGRFDHGSSSVFASTHLTNGIYHPYVFSIIPWNKPDWQRAPMAVTANGAILFDSQNIPCPERACWKWIRGNPLTLADSADLHIEIEGSALDGVPAAYSSLAYLAFVEDNSPEHTRNEESMLPEWPGLTTISPGDTMRWVKELSDTARRVDVWAFESGNNGKAYHIFQVLPNEHK